MDGTDSSSDVMIAPLNQPLCRTRASMCGHSVAVASVVKNASGYCRAFLKKLAAFMSSGEQKNFASNACTTPRLLA
jgi:hypothetical protein